MTIRHYWAKAIPVLWFNVACVVALVPGAPLALAGTARKAAKPRPSKPSPAAKTAKSPKPAPRRIAPQPGSLAALVQAWREVPTPARRTAVASYAAAHAREESGALAQLALGIGAYEQRDYTAAAAALGKLQGKLAPVADYIAYYLAASQIESKAAGASPDLAPIFSHDVASPLAAKGRLIQARALLESDASKAVRLLIQYYPDLPQPFGDLTLADAYQAAGDLPHAAESYQRVYYEYPAGDAASRSAAALLTLKDTMGGSYPKPKPAQQIRRADRLLEIGEYAQARSDYQALLAGDSARERERARVRISVLSFLDGKVAVACKQLGQLEVNDTEAEGERLYYLTECARRSEDDSKMMSAVKQLEARAPESLWRARALITAANRFLLVNRADEYVPLYRAVYENFPAHPQAGLCHWKVAFQAYLRDERGALDLLRDHLRMYPLHATAGAALYFLGRTAERDGDLAAARAYYFQFGTVLQNTYYAGLARERLREGRVAGAAPSAKVQQFLAGVSWRPVKAVPEGTTRSTEARIRRSRLLRSAGFPDFADSELRFGCRTDGQPAILAMEMAESAPAVHSAMRIMKSMAPEYLALPLPDAPRRFWELLFPLPYRDDLFANARQKELDPYLVAGLIRQESEFNPEALSRAKAYGLTQVRPATGRLFARKAGVQRFNARLLFQPATNLKIGTSVLRSMLDQNDGSLERTLAAYNAGPNRVVEWMTWHQYREPAEFVESIPFTETRDYVQAVLRNAELYRRLYKSN